MSRDGNVIRFGTCTIDRDARRLTIGGTPVKLHDRALSLLLYLIDHRDRAVPRVEILREVWQGVTVNENNVAVQLSKVREALRAVSGVEASIVTSELGTDPAYRFVGQILTPSNVGAGEAPAAAIGDRYRWIAAATGFALVCAVALMAWQPRHGTSPLAPRLSFVVLPFSNLGADHDKDYLADEVTDDLVAGLLRLPDAVVISRQSAETVQHRPSSEIGRLLNVRYIVRGTITPESGNYHIYAELIDAPRGSTLAAWSFNRQSAQIADARAEIVGFIVRELNLTVDRMIERDSAALDPRNAGAHDQYYRAVSRLDHDGSLAAYQAAQAMLEDAIAKEPGFTQAKAELGWRLLIKVTNFADPDDVRDYAEARRLIADSIAAAPDNTTALASYARELMLDGKCNEAVSAATKVVGFETGNLRARSTLATCDYSELRFDAAVADYENLLRLNPDSNARRNWQLGIGTILLIQGKAAEALVHLEQCTDETASADVLGVNEQCQLFLIAAHDEAGDRELAKKAYRAYAERSPGRTIWRLTPYFPKKWLALDGFKRAMAALHDAGMNTYADEAESGAPANGQCDGGIFTPTPRTLPNGEVITTAEAVRRINQVQPLVVDLGHHRVEIPGAVYYADAALQDETEIAFALRLAQERLGGDRGLPVMVVGDGVSGCTAFNAAARLVEDGYTKVAWYRGGEEAWGRHLSAPASSTATPKE